MVVMFLSNACKDDVPVNFMKNDVMDNIRLRSMGFVMNGAHVPVDIEMCRMRGFVFDTRL